MATAKSGGARHVAVVGAGLIGRAWAIVFARAGAEVALYDASKPALDAALKAIGGSLKDLVRAGLLKNAAAVLKRIRATQDLRDAVAGAEYVQENTPEKVEQKRAIFAELDRLAPPGAILASSTSTIQPSRFTEPLAGRARCLVAHPANPPHLIPIVELCGAPWTAPATVARARSIMEAAGMTPIAVRKEIEAFILNRLQMALLNEACRLIDAGYVTAGDLDKTLKDGLALRWVIMGPMETIDLNAPGGTADYFARYGALIRALDRDMRGQPDWSQELVGRLDAERRRAVPLKKHGAAQIWRDRRLMALLAHKREAARRIRPA
ncbi:MAG: 3-hydroxyacyl-CoA dehydrogenase [Alphaproteobacteria bacterium]|nr:3-hydroxyacyl-CoA dehydrogenase [Alphaproteobacteria bacterium]